MKNSLMFALVIGIILMISGPVCAFDIRTGETLVIDTPVHDDLIASGDSLTINAPVKSVTFAGGRLTVNAPVETNIIAAGGVIEINAPVGVDVIAAGGTIDITSDVTGKVLAAGGSVEMNGTAENMAASGGMVIIGKNAVIKKDADISSSGYRSEGMIKGDLTIHQDEKDFGGFDFSGILDIFRSILMFIQILSAIGMLILGVVLIHIIPQSMRETVNTARKQLPASFIAGIVALIAVFIISLILMITLIGIPIALFLLLLTILGVFLSGIIAGAALGDWIFEVAKKEKTAYLPFVIGFIILQVLSLLPFGIGFIIMLLATFLGFGALFIATYSLIKNQSLSTKPSIE